MRTALEGLDQALVATQTSSTWAPVRVDSKFVFSHKVVVFPTDSFAFFGILQATFHESWRDVRGSTMRTDRVYTPSDVFETFPRPASSGVAEIAKSFHDNRSAICLKRAGGLTTVYNLTHSPECQDADILELRQDLSALNEAVLHAYGWDDIRLDHGFYVDNEPFSEDAFLGLGKKDRKRKLARVRFTVSPAASKEVLKRLLELNHERHAEELRHGLVEVDEKGKVKPTKKGKKWLQKRREAERKARGVKESERRGSGGARQDPVLTPATPLFGGGTEES